MDMVKQKKRKSGINYSLIFIDCNIQSCSGQKAALEIREYFRVTAASPIKIIGMIKPDLAY